MTLRYLILGTALLLNACTTITTNYGALSLDKQVGQKLVTNSDSHRVEFKECNSTILFIPLGWPTKFEDIMKQMLKDSPGANALADMNSHGTIFATGFYNRFCTYIDGVPVHL